MKRKVSIIVPVFNSEKYLRRCLDSIIKGTYRNLEIIIVNDGSTDASGEICNQYLHYDKRVKVIHQENKGVSAARNAGLDNATGEYIQFVDSDDYISINMTELLVKCVEDDNADWVICSFSSLSQLGDRIIDIKINGHHSRDDFLAVFYDSLRISYFGSPCNKMYLRAIIKDNQIRFDENFSVFEDLIFNIHYFYQVNALNFINKNLYNYCRHNTDSLMLN